MQLKRTFPLVLILSLLIICSTQSSSSAVALEQGASASGEGEFTDFAHQTFHFSFDIQANKQGHAHGQAEFDNLTANTQVVAKIDCLNVIGPEALITGTVLHSNDPNFPKRAPVIFDVLDAQLLEPFHSDSITPLLLSQFIDCHDASSPLTIFQVEGITIDPGDE